MNRIFRLVLVLGALIMLLSMWLIIYYIAGFTFSALSALFILFAAVGTYYWMKVVLIIWKR